MERKACRVAAWSAVAAACVLGLSATLRSGRGAASISTADLTEWLSYIASDELQGRAVFTTGLDRAATYIEKYLRTWNVRPAGDGASYLQAVQVLTVRPASRSTVTIRIGHEVRTFSDGDGFTLPQPAGASQRFTVDRVEFIGYGLDLPAAGHMDVGRTDVHGAAVVWLGAEGPRNVDAQRYRLLLSERHRHAVEHGSAAASIGPEFVQSTRSHPAHGQSETGPEFTTAERLDKPRPPTLSARDAFFEFLFSRSPVRYQELKRRAAAREPLPAFRLPDVTLTFDIDVTYEVVRTQLTHNVVGIVDGSDPVLKRTFVAFGAHYDHVGYAADRSPDDDRSARTPGRVTPGATDDRIWNGADDDGSGTVGLMALARAFAMGARPKRSLLFIWHTGEEAGRYGSLYFADHPTVPIEHIVAHLNIDMIGRNRDDKPSEANTVYLVGSDRISTELHVISRAANAALSRPMTLSYDYNDPSDAESLYTRSDHYSYALKGIPVIFFTTGLHPDYHSNTDEISKIDFDKLSRVVQLVYETGVSLANLDHAPVRDHQGPRAGRSVSGQ